ncbi:MAG: hypothetical protein ABFD81_06080 [Syntrophaceae bacterium]
MSTLFENIGALAGKLANLDGLISGMMSTLDARVVADAVNKNGIFMAQMIANLDPKVLASAINGNPSFMTRLIKELDPAAVAASVNKNQGFLTKMIEALHPNVFTGSAGAVVNKMKNNFLPALKAGSGANN